MTERWRPLLEDPPEIAQILLDALRRALPALLDAALKAPGRPTPAIAADLGIEDDPAARMTVVGRDLQRGNHGPRDALFLSFAGEARFRAGTVTVRGDAVLDLATRAILRLRLSEPVAA